MSSNNYTSSGSDSHDEMLEYQYRLIMSKTPEERFLMGLEMAEAGRTIMLDGIRSELPGLTEEDYCKEFIRRQSLYDPSMVWVLEYL